jgi:hypothetical protein
MGTFIIILGIAFILAVSIVGIVWIAVEAVLKI